MTYEAMHPYSPKAVDAMLEHWAREARERVALANGRREVDALVGIDPRDRKATNSSSIFISD